MTLTYEQVSILLFSFALFAAMGWLIARMKSLTKENASLLQEIALHKLTLNELTIEKTRWTAHKAELEAMLESEKRIAQEKQEIFAKSQQQLADTFKILSADALKNNTQSFLDLAALKLEKFQDRAKMELSQRHVAIDELIKPFKTSLEKVCNSHQELRTVLTSQQATFAEQIKHLATAQNRLESETSNLVKALRIPNVRGRWGEMQLKRVVEIAGMIEHCDFVQQPTSTNEEKRLRPDMIVNLPGGKQIVVDSKTPLQAYLEAHEATTEEQKLAKLKDHARQVRTHISQLASKNYWDQFESMPEFVLLFLPGETFYSSALEQDPTLIEYGVDQRVILATPTTLIALLRAVAYGWNQEKIAENAQKISKQGREIYDRLITFASHFTQLRQGLERTIEAYNKAVGSMESRVLVSARKLKETGIGADQEIDLLEPIDKRPRSLVIEGSPQKEDEDLTKTESEEILLDLN